MNKDQIIEAIKALTEVIKANSDAAGAILGLPVVTEANKKLEELIKQL